MPRSPRPTPSLTLPRAPWRWAVAGVCLGALPALVLWAPARWLATGVQQASGDLRIAGLGLVVPGLVLARRFSLGAAEFDFTRTATDGLRWRLQQVELVPTGQREEVGWYSGVFGCDTGCFWVPSLFSFLWGSSF